MPLKRTSRRVGVLSDSRRARTRATRTTRMPICTVGSHSIVIDCITGLPTPISARSETTDEHGPSYALNSGAQGLEEEDEQDVDEGNEDRASRETAPEIDEIDEASEVHSEPAVVTPRRRPGRPPKTRPPDWGTPDPDTNDASESGTTGRRGRGRGRLTGWRGGPRGRGKRGTSIPVTRPPLDEHGNEMEIENDEVVQPDHSEGEKKIDRDGRLLRGRQYRVRTFTIIGRGDRLYMLSTEPARCTGFRDSYLFFTKHKLLYKIIIGEEEKKDLIERDILPHSYKGRTIGVVTARSVYREFGSKIVVGGRKIVDDYNPDKARARGDIEGELADPYDRLPEKGDEYNRNQYVAWHGASNVYHSNAPTGSVMLGSLTGKKRGAITSANWMHEHAWEASRFNSSLTAVRAQTHNGLYDTQTNLMCFPQIMQPTHAVWEQLDDMSVTRSPVKRRRLTQFNGDGPALTNGIYQEDADEAERTGRSDRSGLVKPTPFLKRNYLVIDVDLNTPRHASWAPLDYQDPMQSPCEMEAYSDGDDFNSVADAGLYRRKIPPVSKELLAIFPPAAQDAYIRERQVQGRWQSTWSNAGACRRPKIGISSMSVG